MLYWPNQNRRPFTAQDGASLLQRSVGLVSVLVIITGFVTGSIGIVSIAFVSAPLFLLLITVQLGAMLDAFAVRNDPERIKPASLSEWPSYTILIALRHEAAMAAQLVAALDALDYPRDKLDVLFLIEADDPATATAFNDAIGKRPWRVVIVPPGGPRTKPNALNFGLLQAKGRFVTVYDAEDLPDPQQLRMAAAHFLAAPQTVMALQAHLSIDNIADGWLPKMMAIEYAALFELTKPGLAAGGYPVALGGTSNHFRTADLRAIGGWDAGNVTEDAELGLRIARFGGRIEDLKSTTHEEAPIHFRGWFRQRQRWLKGWMQTAIAHGRKPVQAAREAGALNYAVGMLQVGGVVMGVLLFPPFFAMTCVSFVAGVTLADHPLDLTMQAVAVVTFLLGAVCVFLPALIGLKQQNKSALAPWLLTVPLYLILVSIAGWFAVVDLIRRPFHWAKTEHGLGIRPRL